MTGGAEAPDGRDPASASGARALFLERHSYRRRRLSDAARLLPIVGAALFLIPLLWPDAGDGVVDGGGDGGSNGAVPTSLATLYIFGVWAGLIVVAALFGIGTRLLGRADGGAERD